MGNITHCKNCGQPLNLIYRFCANCGSSVSEPEMKSHVKESIIEIRLKKPVMIGNYQLSIVFTGLVYILTATVLFTSLIDEFNVPILTFGIFLIILGLSTFFGSDNSSIQKRCPHCRKTIKYAVAQDVVYECPYCSGEIIVIWE